MLDHLLPQTADNTFRGQKLALWLLGMVALLKGVMGLNTIFNTRSVAISADGIPLDTFPPAAAQAVVSLFALLGLANLVICLLCIVALVRYRALIPALFIFLLLEYLSRRMILYVMPLVSTGTPTASIISFVLPILMIAGLALSLWNRGDRPAPEPVNP
jgi:phosphoglycerol transferase MdoB-like AlkP superfamily enzyme